MADYGLVRKEMDFCMYMIMKVVWTRGLKEEDMKVIVDMIDRILSNIDDENVIAEVKKEVNAMMNPRPMFAW